MRMMAARGLLPLPPRESVTAIYVLTFDADGEVQAIAFKTFGALPPPVLSSALEADLDARVLDRLAEVMSSDAPLLERIVLARSVGDETLARIAAKGAERIVEIIAGMDARLLRHPPIIEAIYMNEKTRMSTADRVLELAVRGGIELTHVPAFREMAAAIRDELVAEPTEEPLPDDLHFGEILILGTDVVPEPDEMDEEIRQELERQDEGNESDIELLKKRIDRMTVSQKIRLALVGRASHRSQLVRNSNKLVALAAIKSPKVTDTEVVAYAQSRAISEEVVRYIAGHREWLKTYQVQKSLVMNPKTPLPASMRLLPHMRAQDLKALANNKNIPSALTTAAKNLLQTRKVGS